MSQFQQRYTDRQKRAVGVAQLDGGMTAVQALAALHGGDLRDAGGPVPPPEHRMPKSTAHDCARRLRLEREGRRGGLESVPPDAARAELLRRLTVSADRLTKRLERKSRTGTADEKLAESLAKAARAVRAVVDAQRAAAEPEPPIRPPRGNGNGETSPPEPAQPLDHLAAEIEREDRRSRAAA